MRPEWSLVMPRESHEPPAWSFQLSESIQPKVSLQLLELLKGLRKMSDGSLPPWEESHRRNHTPKEGLFNPSKN